MSDFDLAQKELRAYDADLRLIAPGMVVADGREFRSDSWRVYRYMGSERPVQFVCGWWNEYGYPYETLSAQGLLDMVKALDLNTRFERESADARNAKLLAERKADADAELDEIGKEFDKRISGKFSSPLKRSQSLHRARDKQRAKPIDNRFKP